MSSHHQTGLLVKYKLIQGLDVILHRALLSPRASHPSVIPRWRGVRGLRLLLLTRVQQAVVVRLVAVDGCALAPVVAQVHRPTLNRAALFALQKTPHCGRPLNSATSSDGHSEQGETRRTSKETW